MTSLLNSKSKRRSGSWLTSSFVFASLVPAALLGFGAFVLLLAHESITDTNAIDRNAWRLSMTSMSMSTSMSTSANTNANGNDYFVQHPPDAFEEAFYLGDEPDYDSPQITYEDAHVLQMLANKSHVPFNINRSPNGTSVLKDAGAHPVLTALRDLSNTEGFFNPVCFRYRFPNISLFPTMSVIVPMQNGTYSMLCYTRLQNNAKQMQYKYKYNTIQYQHSNLTSFYSSLSLSTERSGLLALTVHSLLARTPPEILHEIIIIDDNGDLPSERTETDEEEIQTVCHFHPKVKCIHNAQKQGCAGSRLQGIRAATGDVVMVIDSHVEMYSSHWAQHLLLPILENPRTVAMQTLDSLEDLPGHARRQAGSGQNYGVVTDSFLFSYVAERFQETGRGVERPPTRLPFETPFAPGSLFAIRRDEFWRLGGYDEGLAVWGGENTELALKVWTCGYDGRGPPGRIVVVPCSRVGHVYRVNIKETGRWPPPLPSYVLERFGLKDNRKEFKFKGHRADNFTKIVVRNNLRILHVWAGPESNATKGYYRTAFGVNPTDPTKVPGGWRDWTIQMQNDTDILHQLEIKKKNKCKSFEWFDRHVLFKLVGRHHPWHDVMNQPFANDKDSGVSCGQHRAPNCGQCPQGNGFNWCNGECRWCQHGPKTESGKQLLRVTERHQCVPDSQECFVK